MLSRRLLILWCALANLIALAQPAFADGETDRAITQLNDLADNLDEVSLHVERHDLGRLVVLKNNGVTVLESIRANGLGHMGTLGKYQMLIVSYDYSTELFQRITTVRTTAAIARLQALAAIIKSERGFDEVSKITEGIFRQMHKLVLDLIDLPLQDAFRQQLVDLIAPIGRAIATAAVNGDQHVDTMKAGKDVHDKVVALYGAFDAVRVSDAAFNMVINIHGLNEFYAEWTGIGR